MARLPRFVIPGQPQHVLQRGNNRETVFVADEDYQYYLSILKEACQKYPCDLHAYVLMTNHIHMLITPHAENNISKVMQSLGRYYVKYFNSQHRRTGTLWEGRYKATLLDSEQYLLVCSRYIELNPVRASMVSRPEDYPWSSYHSNALGEEDKLLVAHNVYQALGRDHEQRYSNYRALFTHNVSEKELVNIREATNKAWVFGNDKFRDQIEKLTHRQAGPKSKGGDRKSTKYKDNLNINRA